MALTNAASVLLRGKDNLLNDARVIGYDTYTFGPFATADGTGDAVEFIMPFSGEVVEVLYGAESDTADAEFNIENEGSDIFSSEITDWGAGVFDAEPDQNRTFSKGDKLQVAVSAAGTAVVNGEITIVVVYFRYNLK